MGLIDAQVQKAQSRLRFDMAAAKRSIENRLPRQFLSDSQTQDRLSFLSASISGDVDADMMLERIIGGNELQPISYLNRGAIASKSIARIAIRSTQGSGWGTGFLIGPGVLITNNHVLPSHNTAQSSLVQFDYELNLADKPIGPVSFELRTDKLFHTQPELDFTVVAVSDVSIDGSVSLSSFGFLPLIDAPGKALEGEWLTIVQHPAGERKQVCVRENRLIRRDQDVLWYSSDTLAGSSGSPVFNNDWFVVALHHMGVPEYKNGVIQTVDGVDFDSTRMDETRIKWVANEGIRASRIMQVLKASLPDHPLLAPLYKLTPSQARIAHDLPKNTRHIEHQNPEPEKMTSTVLPTIIRLQVNSDGTARILGAGTEESMASTMTLTEAKKKSAQRTANFDAPFDGDYSKRKGFDPEFLGIKVPVDLPTINPAIMPMVAKLIAPTKDNDHILHYHNFSVVMHAERRLAIYTAANVDCENRYEMSRPKDVWRLDPRISVKHQLENWYYEKNNFDRGHLTRREDLEFGPDKISALQSAADTCHWTNCTPQHSQFNQNKEVWQGIERYVLETTIKTTHKLRAQVFTGPVLDEADPDYKDVQYPLQFWKVVVALDADGKLWASAYVASQAEIIGRLGIEAAPFGAFKTFQTSVAEIENLTGLSFTSGKKFLRDHDPFKKRRRRAGVVLGESSMNVPEGYWPLNDVDDIQV